MSGLRDLLQAHLDEAQALDMVWGTDDCTAWVASWMERRTGRAVHRPQWHSEEEARRLIDAAGSLDALWDRVMRENGYPETFEPERGDVGIIDVRGVQVGGIFLAGGYFAWRGAPRGVAVLLPRQTVRAWAIS